MESKAQKRQLNKYSDLSQEEHSTEIDDSNESSDSQQRSGKAKSNLRKGPVTYDDLRVMSRNFHRSVPPNPFYKEKVPYKTIIICFLFLIGGLIFLTLGTIKALEEGFYNSYELFLLGGILFIPGSYHTFIAMMACRRIPGYSYSEVAVFDENFDKDDD